MKDVRILVVDDNKQITVEIEQQLKDLDFRDIQTALSAKEALEIMAKDQNEGNPFGLVLSDWHMPEMSGLEFLMKIRENELTAKLPFIMISAETDSKDILTAIKSGANNYLIKPTNPQKLKQKIEKVFSDLGKEIDVGPKASKEPENLDLKSVAIASETYIEDYDILKEIFNSTKDFVSIIDNENKITRVNPSLCQTLFYDAGDLVGLPYQHLLPDDVKCEDPKSANWRNFRADYLSREKKKVPVLINTSVINDEEGEIKGAIITAKDLRRELELEKMMEHAKKMTAYGKAAGDAPQEIKGPLSAILQTTDEIEKLTSHASLDHTDTQKFLETITHAASDISGVLKKIKSTQNQLLESAHSAGMAEVASGVLHNIGNVVNSLNVAILSLKTTMDKSKVEWLQKANDLIIENKKKLAKFLTKDKKGKELPDFYIDIGNLLKKEMGFYRENIESMIENINVIKNVIESQRSYAFGTYFVEEVDINELLKKVFSMQKEFINLYHIDIEPIFRNLPPINIHKTKVINILVNLLKNAQEALMENEEDNRDILVETGIKDNEVYILFQDNGLGIPEENLGQIFNLKFTTKEHGSGIGLHSCANAMAEMNGRMEVKSDGPGKGATFTLYFPLKT